jgi:NAD+ diphosphatase
MAMISGSEMPFFDSLYVYAGPFLLVCDTGVTGDAGVTGDTGGDRGTVPALPDSSLGRELLGDPGVTDSFSETAHNYTAFRLAEDAPAPAGHRWFRVRDYFAAAPPDVAAASRALSLFNWRAAHHFCGVCGAPLVDTADETARKCTSCNKIVYPAIEPCIIVRVQKAGKILLAKHIQRNADVYTCIAGFVEAGETLEACVAREIREEAAIEVTNIRYLACQAWPFPDQLMCGFSCDWKSGTPTPDGVEIADLRWFARDALPAIPPPGSISHRLIMGEI